MADDTDELVAEVRAWLGDNWDPELSVGDWWERLAHSGWAVPAWPEEWFGKGLSRPEAAAVGATIAEFGALGPPAGLGLLLAGPTIVAHGTDEQKRRFVTPIVEGKEAWCQLFSEPEAGSDLASIRTSAVRDGDEWIINGQKVWTSGGHFADQGMLMARTDPTVPKHAGISYFGIDMHQDAIDTRPLKEMTGRALFNEVFLSDARVDDAALIGGEGNGWAVANTTLMFERAGLGAGGTAAAGAVVPGTVANQLGRRAGDFVGGARSGTAGAIAGRGAQVVIDLARDMGRLDDPVLRQEIMKLHVLGEVARMTGLRAKAARTAGIDIAGLPNIAKLVMSEMTRMSRDIGPAVLGPAGTLTGADAPLGGMIAELTLFAPAVSIYGGTDQVQRNIIGERVLGLPKEPRTDKDVPFSELRSSGQADA